MLGSPSRVSSLAPRSEIREVTMVRGQGREREKGYVCRERERWRREGGRERGRWEKMSELYREEPLVEGQPSP